MNNFQLQCRYYGHDTQNKMILGICMNKNCNKNRAICSFCLKEKLHHDHLEEMLDISDFQASVDHCLQQQQQFQQLTKEIECKFQPLTKKKNRWIIHNILQQEYLDQAFSLFKRIQNNSQSFICINMIPVEQMTTSQINIYVSQLVITQAFYNSKINKLKIIDQNLSNIIKMFKKITSFYRMIPSKQINLDCIGIEKPKKVIRKKIGFARQQIFGFSHQEKCLHPQKGKQLYQLCCLDNQTNMYKVFPDQYNLNFLHVILLGPKNTAFDGGIYQLFWDWTNGWPFKPPKITLHTNIFHINIKNKQISVDILGDQWCPALTIEKTLLSIISLLDDPNPDDPLNFESAALYQRDRKAYYQKVEEYKLQYASPTIEQLISDIVGDLPEKDPGYIFLKGNLTEWLDYWKNFK